MKNNFLFNNYTGLSSLLLAGYLGLLACQDTPYQIGERLYKAQCANCHLDNGQGLGALIPPLAGSDYLVKHRAELACLVRYGIADTILVNGQQYSEKMPPHGKMSDVQIANVLNYVLSSWGNELPPLHPEELKQYLAACQTKQ